MIILPPGGSRLVPAERGGYSGKDFLSVSKHFRWQYTRFWPRERVYVSGVVPVEARVLVLVMTALALFGGLLPES